MPKTYTVNEVAEILGYSTNSIYTFLKEKRIKGVRVGRGRFRIPEEELSRILHLSKKSQPAPGAAATSPVSPVLSQAIGSFSGDAALVSPSESPESNGKVLTAKNLFTPPNVFDWFVGLAAIAAGLGLYLFNTLFGTAEFAVLSPYINAGRVIVILSGVGVIASTMFVGSGAWRKVFYAILCVLASLYAYILYRSADVYGAIFYGGLAFVMAVSVVFRLGGIVSVGGYLSVISLLVPVAVLLYPQDSHFLTVVTFLQTSPQVLGIIISLVCVGFLGMFWVGYMSQPALFTAAVMISAFLQSAAAVFYASIGMWSRAFFLIVVAFFTAILPAWRQIQTVWTKRQRSLLHLVFAGVGAVLALAIMVVYILQQSVWEHNKSEFHNKVTAAQSIVSESVNSVKSSMVVSAANQSLVDALVTADTGALVQLGKVIYESNPNIRRIVFLDAKGVGVSLYPVGSFEEKSYAFRDYFIKVRDTKTPYVSNVFQTMSDNAHRYVLVVAVPVINANKEFVGVITGSINLDRLGNKLQQVAVEQQGEYFIILDGANTILFHPKTELVGTQAPVDDVARRAVSGEKSVVQAKLRDGTVGMIAYAPVRELGWGISLRVPAVRAFTLMPDTVFSVFTVVVVLLIAAIIFLLIFQRKWASPGDVGP